MMPGWTPVPQGAAYAPHSSLPQWQARSPRNRAPRLGIWSSCTHTPKAMTNCHLNGPDVFMHRGPFSHQHVARTHWRT